MIFRLKVTRSFAGAKILKKSAKYFYAVLFLNYGKWIICEMKIGEVNNSGYIHFWINAPFGSNFLVWVSRLNFLFTRLSVPRSLW